MSLESKKLFVDVRTGGRVVKTAKQPKTAKTKKDRYITLSAKRGKRNKTAVR